jgi:hypothetical protein
MHNEYVYKSFEEAIERIEDAREYQMSAWPSTTLENAGGRPFEQWAYMLDHYTNKLREVYTTTPSFLDDGMTPNVEGRKRIEKYAAIVANLAIWMVQSAAGKQRVQD